MLPHVMAYNLEACVRKYASVAARMGVARDAASPSDNARVAIDAVLRLRDDLALGKSIRELGGSDNLLPVLVADAAADLVNRSNPRPLDEAAFESLYRSAW
jgi:alcohol dehydrogenase class IV